MESERLPEQRLPPDRGAGGLNFRPSPVKGLISFCMLLASVLLIACTEQQSPADGTVETVTAGEPSAVKVDPKGAGALDPDSGLIIDEHWELVRAHCGACHSPQLVTQNRGSRQTWLEMIRWMQETQGLWAFDSTTETAILDYLEKNYAPSSVHRRAPISKELMPENPYHGTGTD